MGQDNFKEIISGKLFQARKITNKLKNVAQKDEKISEEEKSLLINIEHNLNNYEDLVKQKLKIPLDSKDFEKIHILEKKIVQDASSEAYKDGNLSEDERVLLKRLIELIDDLSNSLKMD